MGVANQDEVLDTEQETDTDQEPDHGEEGEGEAQTEPVQGEEEAGEGEDEDVVQIGEEEPPASEAEKAAPQWVKDLRAEQKRLRKENAELRARVGGAMPHQSQPTLPAKPKLADFDYDEEKFEQARDAWDAKKREVDAWEANQRQAVEAQQRRVQAINEHYATSRAALRVKDYQEVEYEVATVLDQVQQEILKAGANNPAALVYGLGRNPKKLQELASIKDPVKFTWAAAQLEKDVKVTKRTTAKPPPETTVRGNGAPGTSKATLERLEAEADRTGDRTKVIAYKRQMRQQGK